MIFDIRDYGAIGNEKTLNTAFIQAAINDANESGGGRVLIAGGKYLTGRIVLKSGVDLHLAADGVLLGSPDCGDYPEPNDMVHVNRVMLPRERGTSLIYADEAENICITGNGTIDCNGTAFVTAKTGNFTGWHYDRINAPTPPRVVFFAGCKNVSVTDVTMINQPSGWSYWIHDCDYVTFDRCKINASVEYPNNDGIHINSSRNVTVSNCSITCGDDCLVVRANNSSLKENKVCERVVMTNCNLTSWSAGIRIGWINDGIIRNCTFSNMVMTNTTCGISISLPGRGDKRIPDEGREATHIENLSFDNIIMDRINHEPVRIVLSEKDHVLISAVKNLYFTNIHAKACLHPLLQGRKENLIENIYFNNCTFERVGKMSFKKGAGGVNFDAEYDNSGSIVLKHVQNVVMNQTVFNNVEQLEKDDE